MRYRGRNIDMKKGHEARFYVCNIVGCFYLYLYVINSADALVSKYTIKYFSRDVSVHCLKLGSDIKVGIKVSIRRGSASPEDKE
jgi:hypothetical protein